MSLPAEYINHLRNGHPHIVRSYLSIILPSVVYCGTVNGAHDFGAMAITVTNVSGSIANVEAGMTVYVGTACEDFSISKRRLRSRSGQILTLDENTVTWANGQYITVVDSHELWNVWPYITPDEPYTFYKDRDIAYSDQNLYPNPVAIIAGNHKVGFLDSSLSIPAVTFALDASDSYTIAYGATIVSYAWSCTGGNIASPTSATTSIIFTTAGTYWLKLTVIDSNGKTQSTWRAIRVHDRINDPPYYNFHLSQPITLDWSVNGARSGIELYGDINLEDYPDNALAIIWCEQTFDGVEYYYDDNIKLAGHVRRSSVNAVPKSGMVSFEIETISAIMSNSHMMSVSLEYSNTPGTWYQYYKLTVPRAIHHYWKWHSTLFEVTNVFLPMTETTELVACDDFDVGDLLSVPENFAYGHGIFAHIMADCHDSIRVYRDVHMLGDSDRASVTTLLEMLSQDHLPEIEIVLNTEPTIGHVIVSGGVRDPVTNLLTPIISQAPGEVPLNRGAQKNTIDRLVIASQTAGNVLAGRVLYNVNRYIQEIRLKLAGNYFDAFNTLLPQQWVELYSIENPRDIDVAGNYTVTSVTMTLDERSGAPSIELVLVPEVTSVDGIPGPYPPPVDNPGNGGNGGNGGTPPPWSPPQPPPPEVNDESDVYVSTATQVKGTNTFNEVSPTWDSKYSGISGEIIDTCKAVWMNDGNVIFAITKDGVYRTTDFQQTTPTWELVFDATTDEALADLSPQLFRVLTAHAYPKFIVYILMAAKLTAESSDATAYLLRSFDGGDTWEYFQIYDSTGAVKQYTVKRVETYWTGLADSGYPDIDYVYITIPRLADVDNTKSPWAIGYYWRGTPPPTSPFGTAMPLIRELVVDTNTYNTETAGVNPPASGEDGEYVPVGMLNDALSNPAERTIAEAWLDEYFGPDWVKVINYSTVPTMPKEEGRNVLKFRITGFHFPQAVSVSLYVIGYIFYNIPEINIPTAIDCGKNSPGRIFVGTADKIMHSIDFGETWEDYIADVGANDILCHKQQAQADDDITFWATDGNLYRTTGVTLNDNLYIETGPIMQPYRLSNNPHAAFPLYALVHTSGDTYMIIRINDAEGSSIDSLRIGIRGGRSLLVESGTSLDVRRIHVLTFEDILLSDGDETVFDSKIGDWSDYNIPIRIQSL